MQSPRPGLSNNTCRIEEIVPGQTATFYKNLTVGEAGAHKRISFSCMEDIGGEFEEEPQWFKKALEDKCDQPGDDAGLTLIEASKLSRNQQSSLLVKVTVTITYVM